ncbi:glycerol-3-phosphate 1-O-acyltransferase PlsY [Mycoplasma sp. P36-A1]|uniref:glycerol-3-phosphate 1-O-acyltransferase PlsY n=1 Tax=Mycoplasma sp. P36-A1 TaxID=3252900 RepID=UPI003C2CAB75
MEIINYILIIALGYLIGSIPFALIVGKVFYNKDIRLEGSGNLGGTNAGRTLGKKAGISVILLDIFKAWFAIILATFIVNKFNMNVDPNYAGLAVVFGHCYPIFANFKGGKGVATAAGFVLAINPILLLIALAIFLIILFWKKMVSLSVIVTLVAITILSFIFPMFYNARLMLVILTIFITYKHKANIKRIIDGNENTISWLTK